MKLENKSITSKAMQYRQDIVTRIPITLVELITYMYSKYTKYLAQLCVQQC